MSPESRRAVWVGLGQVALVLLSVGLAVALGEWRQSRADAARAEQAVDAMVREITFNRAEIQSALAYHETLLAAIRAGEQDGVELRSARIVDNAWESAQAAGVVPDLPFRVVEALARVHEMQSVYTDLARMNLGLLYFGNVYSSDRLPSDIAGYGPNVSDLAYVEAELLTLYADAARALDRAGYAVADSLTMRPSEPVGR